MVELVCIGPILCTYLLVLIHQRTIYCPHPYEFRNYSGAAWWYFYLQLVSGEVQYITLYYNRFHHQELAMNDPRFCIFAGFDLSKNYLHNFLPILSDGSSSKEV
jgi:hypothetical protein